MSNSLQQLVEVLRVTFAEKLLSIDEQFGEVSIEVSGENLIEVATGLRDHQELAFQQLV